MNKPAIQKQKTIKTPWAVGGVILILCATLAGIRWEQKLHLQQLLQKEQTRPLAQGEVAPEAQTIPLVADLWDKALYFDNTEYEWNSYENQRTATAAEQKTIGAVYRALMDDNILPAGSFDFSGEQNTTTIPYGPHFFRQGNLVVYQQQKAVSAVVEHPGAKNGFSLETAAKNYIEYLGLDLLEDWKTVHLPPIRNTQKAELYSSSSQLLVQVMVDERGESETCYYSCSVTPVTREGLELRNTAP